MIHDCILRRTLASLIIPSAFLALLLGSHPAIATWDEREDLIYRTAHTLNEGEFEVGVFSPLQYGLNDQVQVAIHPILLLVLAPHIATRWRYLPEDTFTMSLDFEVTWSFLDRVDQAGRRVLDDNACRGCGYPGTIQVTTTASWEMVKGLHLSAGLGPAIDFLDVRPEKVMASTHVSLIWLIDRENLIMTHWGINVHPWEGSPVSGGYGQLMYAHAWGIVHLGVGVALGEFALIQDGPTVRSLPGRSDVLVQYDGKLYDFPVYPMVDVWLRL